MTSIFSVSGYGQSLGSALSDLCADADAGGTPQDVDALCSGGGEIAGVSIGASDFGASLTPTDNVSAAVASAGSSSVTQQALEDRLKDYRSESSGAVVSPQKTASQDQLLTSIAKKMGAFATFKISNGERERVDFNIPSTDTDCTIANDGLCAESAEMGFDYDFVNLLVGVDYRWKDNIIVGVAGSYSSGETDSTSSASSSEFEDYSGFYWDGSFGIGFGENEQVRALNYSVEITATSSVVEATTLANSSADKEMLNASLGAGYTFTQDAWTVSPSFKLNWLTTDIDGYRESASVSGVSAALEQVVADNLLLQVDSQSIDSLTSVAAVDVTHAVSTRWGVLLPMASLSWIHQYQDQEELTAQFLYQSTTAASFSFSTETPDLDKDYYSLGLGMSATLPNDFLGFVYFDQIFGHDDISQWSLSLGIRQEF
jgi:outer membrane autotransporter protein